MCSPGASLTAVMGAGSAGGCACEDAATSDREREAKSDAASRRGMSMDLLLLKGTDCRQRRWPLLSRGDEVRNAVTNRRFEGPAGARVYRRVRVRARDLD